MTTRSKRLTLLLLGLFLSLSGAESLVRILGLGADVRSAVEQGVEERVGDSNPKRIGKLLHPYRGWMARPGGRASFLKKDKFFRGRKYSDWALSNSRANKLGYYSLISDYHELRPGQFVVGIFGGSVASQLATMGGDAIIRRLVEEFPELDGRVVVLNCASGAYKQPQQLFALSELVLLGVPFDVVVNIDGVNEVVFGNQDAHGGYHPILPSRSHYESLLELTSSDPSMEMISAAASISRHRTAVATLLKLVRNAGVLRHSALFQVGVGILIQRHQRAAVMLEKELQSRPPDPDRLSVTSLLSDPCLGPDGDSSELVASLWESGSRLMEAASEEAGANYLHILQPNQYVEDSKVLTSEEREIARDPASIFAREVPRGYPELRRRGRKMLEDGIAFRDFTALFARESETMYVDTCCHMSYQGYQIFGREVANAIAEVEVVRGRSDE